MLRGCFLAAGIASFVARRLLRPYFTVRGGICLPAGYFRAALFRPRGLASHPRHPIAPPGGAGILTRFPSATPFGLALGAGSPWDDYHRPGNLGLTANGFFTHFVVTDCGILSSLRSSPPFGRPSAHRECSPTTRLKGESRASVHDLAPLHFRRKAARPVSYYALFKWWLLLSQHPGCLGGLTSFPTES